MVDRINIIKDLDKYDIVYIDTNFEVDEDLVNLIESIIGVISIFNFTYRIRVQLSTTITLQEFEDAMQILTEVTNIIKEYEEKIK